MEYFLDGILVVEGKQDKAFLSNFIKSPIITVNGKDITNSIYTFLKVYMKEHKIYVMTDQDEAGVFIKDKIKEKGISCFEINVNFKNRKNYRKNGIAECEKEQIIKVLQRFCVEKQDNNHLKTSDLYRLGLAGENSFINIRKVCTYYSLPMLKGKQFLMMLNNLNIGESELKRIINN